MGAAVVQKPFAQPGSDANRARAVEFSHARKSVLGLSVVPTSMFGMAGFIEAADSGFWLAWAIGVLLTFMAVAAQLHVIWGTPASSSVAMFPRH